MVADEPVQCPSCGWTGYPEDIDQHNQDEICPICAESVEILD